MKLELSETAVSQYKSIQEPFRSQIRKKLDSLALNGLALPNLKALTGNLSGWYRLRSGDYRIVFRVSSDTAFIAVIQHRRDVYSDFQ